MRRLTSHLDASSSSETPDCVPDLVQRLSYDCDTPAPDFNTVLRSPERFPALPDEDLARLDESAMALSSSLASMSSNSPIYSPSRSARRSRVTLSTTPVEDKENANLAPSSSSSSASSCSTIKPLTAFSTETQQLVSEPLVSRSISEVASLSSSTATAQRSLAAHLAHLERQIEGQQHPIGNVIEALLQHHDEQATTASEKQAIPPFYFPRGTAEEQANESVHTHHTLVLADHIIFLSFYTYSSGLFKTNTATAGRSSTL